MHFLDDLRYGLGTTFHCVLLNEYDGRVLRFAATTTDSFFYLLRNRCALRDDSCLTATSDSGVQRQEACIATHHLYKEHTLVRRSGVTQFVDTLGDSAQRGVITDRRIGSPKVIVNRARQTDNRYIVLLREESSAGECTVAADDDQRIDLLSLQRLVRFLTTFRSFELGATCRFDDRTATLDNTGNVLGGKLFHFAVYQTFVAAIDSLDANALIDGCACHSAKSGIHSRRVTS